MDVVKKYIDFLMESFFFKKFKNSDFEENEKDSDIFVDRLCRIFLLILNFMI